MRLSKAIVVVASCAIAVALVVCFAQAEVPPDPGQTGPYATDYVTINTTNLDTGSELAADIYYPSTDGVVDPQAAPCPAVVFSHGTSAPRAGHTGNAAHLASWGYIVALPGFPDDDLEVRASDVQHILDYLEAENADPSSTLFGTIATDRLALTGHSLGAMSSFMLAADDDRIDISIVPLDPVNPDEEWNYSEEAPDIAAPMGLIGSPPQICNWNAHYNDIYPHVGSTHKAMFVIVGGSHCDFLDAETALYPFACGLICGQFSEDRLLLIERYSAAWFNYYLRLDTDYYAYLYGEEAENDIRAGLITRTVHTAPRGVKATGRFGSVELNWDVYDHPIVAGYNIYRSQQSEDYSTTPYAQVGREASYADTDVIPGQGYFYVVRSRDSAGNEHQASDEVTAMPRGTPALLSPPDGTVTTTQTITFAWEAGEGPAPEGYNLTLDSTVITTTGTSWASLVPVGVHTWTVRAFDAGGYSDWASPAWTVEVTDTVRLPGVPTLLSPPDGTVTTTQTITFAWRAGEGPVPEGYNLDLDGTVITTAGTSWATILSSGLHSWSARAYNVAGVSGWAVPRTLRVQGYRAYMPLVQRGASLAERSTDRRGRQGVQDRGSSR